jgi:hypothetical protein
MLVTLLQEDFWGAGFFEMQALAMRGRQSGSD